MLNTRLALQPLVTAARPKCDPFFFYRIIRFSLEKNPSRQVRRPLTLAPLAAVGVQVVGVQPLRFVQAVEDFSDVHDLRTEQNRTRC